jgi:integrase
MRGNITRRGKNSWQLKFDVGTVNGKRQTRYATVRGPYKDAQRKLTEFLSAVDTDTLPEPTAMTVGEYVRAWLRTAHDQSPKTLERYGELADNQIIPHLGATKLQKLKPEDVQAWHRTLLDSGLAPRTIGHAHRVFSQVLACAVKNGTLTRNVASVHRPPAAEDTELEILEPVQVKAVLAALGGHTLFPIIRLALDTGMRRGELLGLQWGDIDLDAVPPTLRVERSVEETKAGGLRLKPPKTKRGRRSISLPPGTVAMLRELKVEQMQIRLAIGMGKLESTTVVFGNMEGGVMRPRNLSKSWWRVRQSKKLPNVSFHALRHTHASTLIRMGVDILTISRRLGHSKSSITLDVYGHLIGGADAAAAAAIEGAWK